MFRHATMGPMAERAMQFVVSVYTHHCCSGRAGACSSSGGDGDVEECLEECTVAKQRSRSKDDRYKQRHDHDENGHCTIDVARGYCRSGGGDAETSATRSRIYKKSKHNFGGHAFDCIKLCAQQHTYMCTGAYISVRMGVNMCRRTGRD